MSRMSLLWHRLPKTILSLPSRIHRILCILFSVQMVMLNVINYVLLSKETILVIFYLTLYNLTPIQVLTWEIS